MTFIPSLRKELLELWRTYRFLMLVIVVVFFGMSSPLLAKYTPEIIKMIPGGDSISLVIPTPTVADAIAQYVKNVSQFGILLALLLTMGTVVQEKEKGTAAMVLVKPLPRPTFLLTKILAIGLAFLSSLLLAALGAYYYTWILFEPINLGLWLVLNLFLWVYFLVYISLTLLFSTVSRSQAAAAGLSFGVLVLLGLLGSFGTIGEYLPSQLMNWGAGLMAGVTTSYWPALIVSLAIIVVSLILSIFSFNKQEL
jgi:ABC-2 type transport system permease protein